ncbi:MULTISPECIES: flavin reductase family protein [Streptomyces]|uniref:Flavin reductase (DIM6/NTAB) family NADH-FMN oxidoreductase RutF n=1 Tax=Streptomyces nymphaeiformis TaxID=2663842 RepID=A0A7W7XGS7_9ACTN|nr:flavin reductase family protein [Streptomyces nymphaeiformis]MBB4986821.1 flavin reductase (DIM6/NTAB) family NADH-FMN oxidoreductase RutF [Streptomyces nymphaeiformis]
MTGLDGFTDVLDYPMFVVTAAADGERGGCLVGFASQCSIDPPRFMAWLSTANRTYRVARRASHLAVHALGREQKPVAELFGGRTGDDTDKFDRVAWRPGDGGAPVLEDCCAWFVGRVEGRVDGGDHVGFLLAPVTHSPPGPVRPPLLRFGDVVDLSPGHPA